jgi:hypothetical protein
MLLIGMRSERKKTRPQVAAEFKEKIVRLQIELKNSRHFLLS